MSKLDSFKLTHPELLSEHQLRELLKNSCIDTVSFEKLCKSELLEMYKRVAMPLPQRQRGNAKTSDAEVDVTAEETSRDNNICRLSTSLSKGAKRMSESSQLEDNRSKSPVNDQKSIPKKIRLSSMPSVENTCNGISKRRCDKQNELQESLMKKRQKITWP